MNYLSREEETSPLSRVLETHRFKHASKLTKIGAEVGRPSLLNRGGAELHTPCRHLWCVVSSSTHGSSLHRCRSRQVPCMLAPIRADEKLLHVRMFAGMHAISSLHERCLSVDE